MTAPINSNRNNLSNKATIFRFSLEKISFMYDGTFLLKLTIINSILSDKSAVRLRTKDSSKFLKDFSVRTEIIGPIKKEAFANFVIDEYSFYLPKGLCKNDMDHDVYLLVEALQVLPDSKTQLIGSTKVPIYPRTDVVANFSVERGEPFYQMRGSTRLLRPNIKESSLHCGDLVYRAEFSEIQEIIEPDGVPPPRPALHKPQPPPKRDPEPILDKVLPPPTPPPKKMIEVSSSLLDSPKPAVRKPNEGKMISFGMSPPHTPASIPESFYPPEKNHSAKNVYHLLSPPLKEEISIFVRAAENITNSHNTATKCYVICSLKTDDTVSDSTTVSGSVTSSPFWEEILNLTFTPDKSERILSIAVIDFSSTTMIAEFLLPIRTLEPFFQHHLKLRQSYPRDNVNPTLYVTIIRKLDRYPLTGKEHSFSALIIKPLSLFHQLYSVNRHSLSCFAYLSNDKTQKISQNIQSIDENFCEMYSPVPSNYSYTADRKHPMWSWGQLSIPSSLQRGFEVWNFPFLFCQRPEIDTAFTADSFIVLDFYSVPASSGMNWRNNPPVAQSILKLDKLLYRQLQDGNKHVTESCEFAINWDRLAHWALQSTELDLQDVGNGNKLSMKIVLTKDNLSDGIYPELVDERTVTKHKVEKMLPVKPGKIPVKKEPFLYKIRPAKSLSSVDFVFNEMDHFSQSNHDIIPPEQDVVKSRKNKENPYRSSLKRMQIELLNLRKQCSLLQSDNENLEYKLSLKRSQETNIQRAHVDEVGDLSVADIYTRYDTLRRKLGTQMSLLSEMKTKENNLRSTLNEEQKQGVPPDFYKQLKTANDNLRKLEHKAKAKEDHIVHLEQILDGKEISPQKLDRYDIDDGTLNRDDERSQLYDLIERSEARIRSLQNELVDLSRKRGARKQMLRIREREQSS